MEIKELIWVEYEGHFGKSWRAEIKDISVSYFIWIDRNTGKTRLSDLENKHKEFNSIQEAKNYCQENFKQIIYNFI